MPFAVLPIYHIKPQMYLHSQYLLLYQKSDYFMKSSSLTQEQIMGEQVKRRGDKRRGGEL